MRLAVNAIDKAIHAQPVEQGDTPLLDTHVEEGRGWSCAQWIIRTLQIAFVQKGYLTLDPSDSNGFYRRVCALGRHIKEDSEDDTITADGVTREVRSVNGWKNRRRADIGRHVIPPTDDNFFHLRFLPGTRDMAMYPSSY